MGIDRQTDIKEGSDAIILLDLATTTTFIRLRDQLNAGNVNNYPSTKTLRIFRNASEIL